ncbi:hypothetical protein DFH09DRAFT_1366554 [Mycena vulgaris]|nr:hypothetical protein DFH09DRAFT_1366554 [Mycena vulgaris]
MEVEVVLRPSGASSDPPEPSGLLPPPDSDDKPEIPDEGSALETLSTTVWYDTDIISKIIRGRANINRQTKMEAVEYLDDLPPYLPIPRIPTAYIMDLRAAKFDFYDEDEVLCAHDSWATSGGGGDYNPTCLLFDGTKIICRRSRHKCNGCYRCSELDVSLVNVTRYKLDPSSRAEVVAAEIATRMAESDSPEKLAAIFYGLITSPGGKCSIKDDIGAPCEGHPMMKRWNTTALRKSYFITCSQWTSTWRGHRSDSIPDYIDETFTPLTAVDPVAASAQLIPHLQLPSVPSTSASNIALAPFAPFPSDSMSFFTAGISNLFSGSTRINDCYSLAGFQSDMADYNESGSDFNLFLPRTFPLASTLVQIPNSPLAYGYGLPLLHLRQPASPFQCPPLRRSAHGARKSTLLILSPLRGRGPSKRVLENQGTSEVHKKAKTK